MLSPASAEINLAVVDAHMKGEVADPATIMDLYADGIVLDMPSRHMRLDTVEAIENNYRALFGAIELLSMQPLDRFATHDRVVDDCIVQFTVTGKGYEKLPFPVGAIIEMRLLHVFQMQNGKIARETVFEIVDTDPMMAPWFLRCGVIFAVIGIGLGIYMGKVHDFTLMPVHAHINLVGWVSFFLAGLFYAVRPAADGKLAMAHMAFGLPGLTGLTTGIAGSVLGLSWGPVVAIIGSVLVLTGFVLFAVNVFHHARNWQYV